MQARPSDIQLTDSQLVILQLRLYALYFGNKRVLLAMAAVSVGAALGSAYVMGAALKKITGTDNNSGIVSF